LFWSEKPLGGVANTEVSAWHFVCNALLDYFFQEINSMSNMNPDEKKKQDQWKKSNDPMKDQKRDQKGQQPQGPSGQPWQQPGHQGQQGQQGQKPQQPKPQHGQHHTDEEKDPNKRTA